MSQPGVDYPDEKTVLDVFTDGQQDSLTSIVQQADGGQLVLTVAQERSGRRVHVDVGGHLELVWRGPDTLHGLFVQLEDVAKGAEPTWRVRPTGPVRAVQRRDAVRAPVRLKVVASAGGDPQSGWTVDLSEGGIRCTLQGVPLTAEGGEKRRHVGDVLTVTVVVDGTEVTDQMRVVRLHPRTDGAWEASLCFTGLGDKVEDLIRKRVFTELRALRAKGHL